MAVERLCFSITIFIWLHYRLAHILISTGTKSGPFPLTASICSALSNMLTLRNSAASAHRSNSQTSSGPLRPNYGVINVIRNCAYNCGRVCARACVCGRTESQLARDDPIKEAGNL